MVKVIYGDVLLLIDFCMNFFVLYTTSIILRRRIKLLCIGGAAFVGGIYSVIKLFVNGNSIVDCIISIFVGILMCYISFGAYRFLKSITALFCTSALTGGIMYATYFIFGSFHKDYLGNVHSSDYSHIPVWLFVVLAAVSFAISWVFSYIERDRSDKSEIEITITYLGRSTTIDLLLDSGNLVKEPISGKYVIMLCLSKARTIIGEQLYAEVMSKKTEELLSKRFRLVCAFGLGGERRTYYAFLPEKILVENNKEIDAYIAVCDNEVVFSECDGIVHPALIN